MCHYNADKPSVAPRYGKKFYAKLGSRDSATHIARRHFQLSTLYLTYSNTLRPQELANSAGRRERHQSDCRTTASPPCAFRVKEVCSARGRTSITSSTHTHGDQSYAPCSHNWLSRRDVTPGSTSTGSARWNAFAVLHRDRPEGEGVCVGSDGERDLTRSSQLRIPLKEYPKE